MIPFINFGGGGGSGEGLTVDQAAQLATSVRRQPVASISALAALTPAAGDAIDVLGYAAAGDGGGGLWRYDGSSSATANAGTIVAPNAGAGRWLRVFAGSMSVDWFGAKGDGTTNDTVAIRAAIAAAGSTPLTFAPGKTYLVSGANTDAAGIQVASNSTLIGYGATIKMANTQPVLSCVVSIIGKTNVRISGLRIDGNKANQNSTGDQDAGCHGIRILSGSDIYLADITVTSCWTDGLYISDTDSDPGAGGGAAPTRIYVDNCIFDANARQGASIINIDGLTFTKCAFTNTGGKAPGAGVDFEPNTSTQNILNVAFTACRFASNAAEGVLSLMRGGTLNTVSFLNCTFSGNTNESVQFNCNEVSTIRNISIKNCAIDNQVRFGRSAGLNSSNWSNNTVEGCAFTTANGYVSCQFVEGTSRSVVIRGCDFSGSTKNPNVLVNQCTGGYLVEGNTFGKDSRAGDGVRIINADSVNITNNQFYRLANGVITQYDAAGTSNVLVTGNFILDCTSGLTFATSSIGGCFVDQNTIRNSTTGISGVAQVTAGTNIFSGNTADTS